MMKLEARSSKLEGCSKRGVQDSVHPFTVHRSPFTDHRSEQFFKEVVGHNKRGNQFQSDAQKKAQQGSHAGFERPVEGSAPYAFPDNGPDERTEDNAYGRKEKNAEDHADSGSPNAGPGASGLFGAPDGYDVIQDGHHQGESTHAQEEGGGEMAETGKLQEQQPGKTDGRARKNRNNTSGNADDHENNACARKKIIDHDSGTRKWFGNCV